MSALLLSMAVSMRSNTVSANSLKSLSVMFSPRLAPADQHAAVALADLEMPQHVAAEQVGLEIGHHRHGDVLQHEVAQRHACHEGDAARRTAVGGLELHFLAVADTGLAC